MAQLVCLTCHHTYSGRPNSEYCGPECRRVREYQRRTWDKRAAVVTWCEKNAALPLRTPKQRENWLKRAEELREKLGQRP